jgi:hypothetical protein
VIPAWCNESPSIDPSTGRPGNASPSRCNFCFAPTNPLLPIAANFTDHPTDFGGRLRQFSISALINPTALFLPLVQGWIRPEERVNCGDRKAQPVVRIYHVMTDAAKSERAERHQQR